MLLVEIAMRYVKETMDDLFVNSGGLTEGKWDYEYMKRVLFINSMLLNTKNGEKMYHIYYCINRIEMIECYLIDVKLISAHGFIVFWINY